ncbi:MAG: DUF2129 domain-containing protein [Tenericutes bacterium]|nr:DUF2129 domain-containing protein [Mycoplasmatota bacterium]
MVDRKGIVIYFQNKKAIKVIKELNVNVSYVNEAGRYLTGYCNTEDFPTIKKELKKHKLIRKVDESLVEMPDIGL